MIYLSEQNLFHVISAAKISDQHKTATFSARWSVEVKVESGKWRYSLTKGGFQFA